MRTDELIPSPRKRTFVALASGYKSAPGMVGEMGRPYAMTSHGTSPTEEITTAENATAAREMATPALRIVRLPIVEIAAAMAPAAARPIRNCCEPRVPRSGMRKRLKANAPTIEPAVFAA